MSDEALSSSVFDKFRNSELLWYHHIQDQTLFMRPVLGHTRLPLQ
jgi:hypothetical protein